MERIKPAICSFAQGREFGAVFLANAICSAVFPRQVIQSQRASYGAPGAGLLQPLRTWASYNSGELNRASACGTPDLYRADLVGNSRVFIEIG
jgi:hypothetical protein